MRHIVTDLVMYREITRANHAMRSQPRIGDYGLEYGACLDYFCFWHSQDKRFTWDVHDISEYQSFNVKTMRQIGHWKMIKVGDFVNGS